MSSTKKQKQKKERYVKMKERTITRIGAVSNYSKNESAVTPAEIVRFASNNGESAVALADYGTVNGFAKFACAAARYGVKPIFAVRVKATSENREHSLILIAANREGLKSVYAAVSKLENGCLVLRELLAHRDGMLIGIAPTAAEMAYRTYDVSFADFAAVETSGRELLHRKNEVHEFISAVKSAGKPVIAGYVGNYITPEDKLCLMAIKGKNARTKRIANAEETMLLYMPLGEEIAKELVIDGPSEIERRIEYIDILAPTENKTLASVTADVEKVMNENGVLFFRGGVDEEPVYYVSDCVPMELWERITAAFGKDGVAFASEGGSMNCDAKKRLDELLTKHRANISQKKRRELEEKIFEVRFDRIFSADINRLVFAPGGEKITSFAPVKTDDFYGLPTVTSEDVPGVVNVTFCGISELAMLKKLRATGKIQEENENGEEIPGFFGDMTGIGCQRVFEEISEGVPKDFDDLVRLYEKAREAYIKNAGASALESHAMINAAEYLKVCVALWKYKKACPLEFYAAALSENAPFFKAEPLLVGLEATVDARDEEIIKSVLGDNMSPVAVEAYDVALECYRKRIKFLPPDKKLSHKTDFLSENGAIRLPLGKYEI